MSRKPGDIALALSVSQSGVSMFEILEVHVKTRGRLCRQAFAVDVKDNRSAS